MESTVEKFENWMENNHPNDKFSIENLSKVLCSNPRMSFRNIRKELMKMEKENTVNEDTEIKLVDEETVIVEFKRAMEGAILEGLKEAKKMSEEEEVKEEIKDNKVEDSVNRSGITYNVRSRGRCDDIVDRASEWASDNPKSAIAVGVGVTALAGYGLYKIVKSAV